MSILIVSVEPNRVLVAVDTLSTVYTGAVLETSKLLVIPHRNIVLAVRGVGAVMHSIWSESLFNDWSFDELLNRAPGLMHQQHFVMQERREQLSVPDHIQPGNQELLVAGFSASAKCLRAVHFPGGPELSQGNEIDGTAFAPGGFAEGGPLPDAPESDADTLAIGNRLVARARKLSRGVAAGGRLIVAEVGRDQTAVRDLGALASPTNSYMRLLPAVELPSARRVSGAAH